MDQTKIDLTGYKKHENYVQVRAEYKSPIRKVMEMNQETHAMLPHIDSEIETGYFELILPTNTQSSSEAISVAIHYAGTGDHGYKKRRENLALPLLQKHNVGSLIYENAFYGNRKPDDQKRSALRYLTDLCIVGGCIGLENPILINFLKHDLGIDKIAFTGVSFGGHLASFSKAWTEHENIACIPTLSWTDSSIVWTDGLMSHTIGYDQLSEFFFKNPEYSDEIEKLKKTHPNLSAWDYSVCPETRPDLYKNKKAVEKVRQITSRFSDLKYVDKPKNGELIKFVVAQDDAYYPQLDSVSVVEEIWPEAEVLVYPRMGHVEGYIRQNTIFADNISAAFEKVPVTEPTNQGKYTQNLNKLLQNCPSGDDEIWIDNKTKFIAMLDPIVVYGIKSVRALFDLKDFWYKMRDRKRNEKSKI